MQKDNHESRTYCFIDQLKPITLGHKYNYTGLYDTVIRIEFHKNMYSNYVLHN